MMDHIDDRIMGVFSGWYFLFAFFSFHEGSWIFFALSMVAALSFLFCRVSVEQET